MLIDAHNLFSDAQAITTGSESGVLSTNAIDLGVAGRNIGVGENLYVVVIVDTLLAGAGDTCTVALVTAAYEALNSPTTLQTIGTFAAAAPVGSRLVAKVQPATFLRYIGLLYTAAGSGALEAGAFTAFLTHDIDAYTSYADNITIS